MNHEIKFNEALSEITIGYTSTVDSLLELAQFKMAEVEKDFRKHQLDTTHSFLQILS